MTQSLRKLDVPLTTDPYPIYIGAGILTDTGLYIPEQYHGKVFILTDHNVGELYANKIQASLSLRNISSDVFTIPSGEKSKSFSGYETAVEWLLAKGVKRGSLLIALGGGVVGDLAGFVAATALRGVDFIQMPTSLLAQVDSSVGGKTGINTKAGKNLVGAFHQPKAVVIDTDTLKTLPQREILAGYAEIVKYALLGDEAFFEWLSANAEALIAGDSDNLGYAIEKSCSMKAEIVAQDEFEETGLRALLNLGHTFAHALESACGYDGRLLHGEAVGIGIVLAARLSAKMEMISDEDISRIERHLKILGLKTEIRQIEPAIGLSSETLYTLMQKDKKATSRGLTFVLLDRVGHAVLRDDVPDHHVLDVLRGSL